MADKYTLRDLLRDFSTTAKCLDFLLQRRWPDGIECRKCEAVTRHHLRISHKAYSCQACGTMVSPTIGTIFHRSKVSLPDWLYVIYTLAQTRTGIAAKQIEREIDVSYKTALRMCNAIRSCMGDDWSDFEGVCEADETYVGGKPRYRGQSKRGRGTRKVPVIGVIERGGRVSVKVVDNVRRDNTLPFIQSKVQDGSTVYTDEYQVYDTLPDLGYEHDRVKHRIKQYVKVTDEGASVHTNNMEGYWTLPKNAIRSVHRGVSRHRMQGYFDEHSFRHSHRSDEEPMFFTLLDRILGASLPVQAS